MLIFQGAFSTPNDPEGEKDTSAKSRPETSGAELILNAKRIDQNNNASQSKQKSQKFSGSNRLIKKKPAKDGGPYRLGVQQQSYNGNWNSQYYSSKLTDL